MIGSLPAHVVGHQIDIIKIFHRFAHVETVAEKACCSRNHFISAECVANVAEKTDVVGLLFFIGRKLPVEINPVEFIFVHNAFTVSCKCQTKRITACHLCPSRFGSCATHRKYDFKCRILFFEIEYPLKAGYVVDLYAIVGPIGDGGKIIYGGHHIGWRQFALFLPHVGDTFVFGFGGLS